MEVLDSRLYELCNFEVMLTMQTVREDISTYRALNFMKFRSMEQLATITYETILYLESMPTVNQTKETISEYTAALAKLGLNKHECLMLVNMPPKNLVDLCVVIEEGDTRFSDEQMEQILELTRQHFPWVKPENE